MKILVKRNNRLVNLGEGRIFSKSQLKLNELDANIGSAVGIKDAQMRAQRLANTNAGVTSASIDAGKADGQNDSQSGEGVELKIPMNATGKQLAQADRMTKDQSMDDARITFTKTNPSSSSSMETNEERIREIRDNSISFTKSEMDSFLSEL